MNCHERKDLQGPHLEVAKRIPGVAVDHHVRGPVEVRRRRDAAGDLEGAGGRVFPDARISGGGMFSGGRKAYGPQQLRRGRGTALWHRYVGCVGGYRVRERLGLDLLGVAWAGHAHPPGGWNCRPRLLDGVGDLVGQEAPATHGGRLVLPGTHVDRAPNGDGTCPQHPRQLVGAGVVVDPNVREAVAGRGRELRTDLAGHLDSLRPPHRHRRRREHWPLTGHRRRVDAGRDCAGCAVALYRRRGVPHSHLGEAPATGRGQSVDRASQARLAVPVGNLVEVPPGGLRPRRSHVQGADRAVAVPHRGLTTAVDLALCLQRCGI